MSTPDARVWLIGRGALHDALRASMREHPDLLRCVPDLDALRDTDCCGVLVSAHHGWDFDREQRIQLFARDRGLRHLHCRTDGALGIVGPYVRPSEPGCVFCAEWRRRLVVGTATPENFGAHMTGRGCAPAPWVESLAAIAWDLVLGDLRGLAAPAHRVYVMNGATLSGQWHAYTPLPTCSECGTIPDDSPELAEYVPRPLPRRAEEFRPDGSIVSCEALRSALGDWRYGVIPHLSRANGAPLAVSVAELPISRTDQRAAGYGRAGSFADSTFVALLEALERHAGSAPNGKRTVVRGTFADLARDAVDPAAFGLHDPRYVGHPAFKLAPYSPHLEMSWVWAFSFRESRPVLVPEQLAYYRRSGGRTEEQYIYESSNGCALGSSLEDAILHGLFEVIERDAFLLAWYGRLHVPELTLGRVRHPLIGHLVDKVEQAGFSMHAFDITSDFGVPAVWAMAVSHDDDRPRSLSAAGAHFDPIKATVGALIEVAVSVAFKKAPDRGRHDALVEMLAVPENVATLDDHVDLYTIPESVDRLAFLFRPDRERRPVEEAFPRLDGRRDSRDLTECLLALVSDVIDLGLDMIAVDVTSAEQRPFGLRTAKVLVPGSIPMTFGHVYHRTQGLSRLLSAPVATGHWPTPRSYDELDVLPHPFP